MKRFPQPFHRLHGKLTFSYTLTTVVTFLLIEVLTLGIAFWIANANISNILLSTLTQETPQAAPYFVYGVPDRKALTIWLHIVDADVSNSWLLSRHHPTFLTVVDTQGQTVVSIGTHPLAAGTSISAQLSAQNRVHLSAVLHDGKGTTSTVDQDADGTLVAITPIVEQGENVQGALVLKIAQANRLQQLTDVLALLILTSILITTIAALAGMVFGSLTARNLTRRLKRLSVAADLWSRGNFSALAHDPSQDELGQMARQLNRMAEQLQNLLSARQKLATLEERNRLARDLHDSVKQQIFAVSMQIGATKVLLRRDVDAAETRLNEAQKLVNQAQQELTSLIRELRPVALEGKGLVAALRELVNSWTQHTDIAADLHAEDVQTLSLTVEEALFRIAQEALANVARHSKATLVQITLTTTDDTVTLSIIDNGQGFDRAHQAGMGVGLLSMQERMKALSGDVQIESTPGKGTRIIARCKRSGVSTSDAATPSNNEGTKDVPKGGDYTKLEGLSHLL